MPAHAPESIFSNSTNPHMQVEAAAHHCNEHLRSVSPNRPHGAPRALSAKLCDQSARVCSYLPSARFHENEQRVASLLARFTHDGKGYALVCVCVCVCACSAITCTCNKSSLDNTDSNRDVYTHTPHNQHLHTTSHSAAGSSGIENL